MKSMDGSSNNNNWLGFSLSSHMTMDAAASADSLQREHHHHQQYSEHFSHEGVSSSLPTSSCLSSTSQMNSQGFCYGVVAENGGFHSPLTVMPLKSDGSLCIMEALNNSQPMCESFVPSLSPKLEDFLGGATRETMALSLDSIYYQNPQEPQTNNRQLQQQDHSVQMNYYSGFSCHGLYQPPFEGDGKVTLLGNHSDSHFPHVGHHHNHHDHDSMLSFKNQMLLGMVDSGGVGCCRNGPVAAIGCGGGELQSLTLSMSPGSQSSCVTAPGHITPSPANECLAIEESKKRVAPKTGQKQTVHRKSIETFGQRTSQYRGVTRHRWTGRYEAHLWDNSCKKEGQTRKGRQVYLGGYDMEEKAARAYDLAALKYWGPSTHTNFPVENYREELEEMKNMTRQEYVAHLRRKSSGFSRGASMYRGVTRHHQHGRWQARIGRVAGNKDLYLGTFSTQEEAAEAYDIAAIKFRGVNAVTNFDISRYDIEKIMASNTLLAGELARRSKETQVNNHNELIAYNDNQTVHTNANVENVVQTDQNQRNPENGSGFVGNYQAVPMFQNLVADDGAGKAAAYLSNPSSLVTSLSSSREGSPDKNGPNLMFEKHSSMGLKFVNPTAGVASWLPSAQLNPSSGNSVAHFPVLAAWNNS